MASRGMVRFVGVPALFACVALAGCSTSSSSRQYVITPSYPEGLPSPACADICEAGDICGYALDGGCDAAGICLPLNPIVAVSCKPFNLCGCQGVVFVSRCDLPAGYSQEPSAGGYLACESDAAATGAGAE